MDLAGYENAPSCVDTQNSPAAPFSHTRHFTSIWITPYFSFKFCPPPSVFLAQSEPAELRLPGSITRQCELYYQLKDSGESGEGVALLRAEQTEILVDLAPYVDTSPFVV